MTITSAPLNINATENGIALDRQAYPRSVQLVKLATSWQINQQWAFLAASALHGLRETQVSD